MHLGPAASTDFLERLVAAEVPPGVDVVVCPPFVSLPASSMVLAASPISLGAQNVHWEDSGAFTGEVSAPMLKEAAVEWVIVGHSERRTLFGESDESVARRARAAQEHDLTVIYCVGETLEERDAGVTTQVLDRQSGFLADLDPHRLVVAYEPVWAIGTGHTASPKQAQDAHAHLRGRLGGIFGNEVAADVRILYGGSLKPGNADELLGQEDVDGGLIGGASLDVDSFCAIIRAAADHAAGV
jgi:triosephosphate isomerase